MRCLVCQNESLADSQADLAEDLRQEIYHMVKQGKNIQQIQAYFLARYGDFILLKPRFAHFNMVLWLAPLSLLLLGCYLL